MQFTAAISTCLVWLQNSLYWRSCKHKHKYLALMSFSRCTCSSNYLVIGSPIQPFQSFLKGFLNCLRETNQSIASRPPRVHVNHACKLSKSIVPLSCSIPYMFGILCQFVQAFPEGTFPVWNIDRKKTSEWMIQITSIDTIVCLLQIFVASQTWLLCPNLPVGIRSFFHSYFCLFSIDSNIIWLGYGYCTAEPHNLHIGALITYLCMY